MDECRVGARGSRWLWIYSAGRWVCLSEYSVYFLVELDWISGWFSWPVWVSCSASHKNSIQCCVRGCDEQEHMQDPYASWPLETVEKLTARR